MSILDAAAALLGGLFGGDDTPTRRPNPSRPAINNRPVQGPSLGRREVAARRESAGLATTGRSVRSTGGNVRVKDATNLTTRDDKPKRDKPYQPGMRSAFGLPTRAAHSRMRMDDFAGLVKTREDRQRDRPGADDLLNAARRAITYRTEASREAENAARNASLAERVRGFAPSVDEPDPMQALMMSLAGLRVGAAPTALRGTVLPAAPEPMQIGTGRAPNMIGAARPMNQIGAGNPQSMLDAIRPMLQLPSGPPVRPLTPISAPRVVEPGVGPQPSYNSPIEDWMWRYATK